VSGGPSCNCLERKEPITVPAGINRPGRLWRVVDYKCNYSKFNGSRYTPSQYSLLHCLRCGRFWRTKASYVDTLQTWDSSTERYSQNAVNRDGTKHMEAHYYEAAMEAAGRTPYDRKEHDA
jgi:hypothetical protein